MLFLLVEISKKAEKYKLLPLLVGIAYFIGNGLNLCLQFLTIGGCTLRVSVRFFTSLREIIGKREETLEFSGGETVTVDKILKRLAKRYGRSFVEYVYDNKTGEVKGFLQFLVNGRSTSTLNSLDTELADGDVLAIIPPVGGG